MRVAFRWRVKWAAWLLLGCSNSALVAATLEGSVKDAHGKPVAHANIHIQLLEAASEPVTVQADAAGHYRVSSLAEGTYRIRAEVEQIGTITLDPFALQEDETKTLDLRLEPLANAVEFFDPPTFTVAGVTDNTYLGGHGSDTVSRSKEDLAKATASLSSEASGDSAPLAALREFQRAAERDPSEPHIFDWGTELLVHGAPGPASEIFNAGIRGFPQSSRMRLGAAVASYTQGKYPQAASRFFEATDLNPNDPRPYLFLAKVEAPQILDLQGFRERITRFAKLQPDNPCANYYYALTLWRSRKDPQDLARVRKLLENALRLDPQLAAGDLQLGILYSEQSDLSSAINSYKAAIELDPQMPEAHYRLAQAYRQSGSPQKAREETAIFQQLSRTEAQQIARERSEMQKFVIALKSPASP